MLIYSGLAFSRIGIWSSASLLHSDALRKNFPIFSGNGIVTAEEIMTKTQGRQVPSTMLELLERFLLRFNTREKQNNPRK